MSIKLFCSFTVAINLICSGKPFFVETHGMVLTFSVGLISWRILNVRKNVTGLSVRNDSLTNLVVTIIESGMRALSFPNIVLILVFQLRSGRQCRSAL